MSQVIQEETGLNICQRFWASRSGKETLTQLQRYEKNGSPEEIKDFIRIGGGSRMGITLEEFGRFQFPSLEKRREGKNTGHDHVLRIGDTDIFVEQKSSGHWGNDDYKWQHVEINHNWNFLLLCGIDYHKVIFWGMDRETFNRLIAEKKITNQGKSTGESSEGMWMRYSDVKDSLIEINTDEELVRFAASIRD
jgi:hypothetical protein